MFDTPIDLGAARVLVTNDDGINAPGLKLLAKIARGLCRDVWVVAPEQEQSGSSHSLTLSRPLRIRKLGARRFAVDGTPTDCVLLAINTILRQQPPTLVLSGINAGANLGEDLTYSGTVAAAMEAILLGVPAIALSQHYQDRRAIPWRTAERHAAPVIKRLTALPWPRNTLINVNFPGVAADAVTGVVATRQGRRKIGDGVVERADPRGRAYYWIGPLRDESPDTPGTDLHAVTQGKVSLSPIYLDLTNGPALAELKKVFS
jgi:5'-nucleotidase